jgi:hypothetical protein
MYVRRMGARGATLAVSLGAMLALVGSVDWRTDGRRPHRALVATTARVMTAARSWDAARVLPGDGVPRAAAAMPGGGFELLASGGRTRRYSWEVGAGLPRVSALPTVAMRADTETEWAVNARGDAVLTSPFDPVGPTRVVAVDASGAASATSMVRGHGRDVPAEIGDDGTAAIAWVLSPGSRVALRVRPPGGAWGNTVSVRARGFVDGLALDVRPDGIVDVVFLSEGGMYEAEVAPGAVGAVPVLIAPHVSDDEDLSATTELAQGRVVVALESHTRTRLMEIRRTERGVWTPARMLSTTTLREQDIEPPPGPSLAHGPEGRALLASATARGIVIRWAAPGDAFGPAVRVATVKRGWRASGSTAALSAAGNAIVAWQEQTNENPERLGNVCGSPCHARVRTVSSPSGGAFGFPAVVSPLGTVNVGSRVVAAIGPTGERLVAWQANGFDRPGAVVVARGGPGPDAPASSDTRPPRLTVAASLAALRAAARSGRLRLTLGCGERCAIAASILSLADEDKHDVDDLPVVVLRRTQRVTWTLSHRQRRALNRLLRLGRVRVTAHAVDAAGNTRHRYVQPASATT